MEMSRELGKLDDATPEEAADISRMVGLGALKYFILKVDPKKTMLFDPRESIDFNGNTGPFIQYTHARICSVLRKAGEAGIAYANDHADVPLVAEEIELIKTLDEFPATVRQAGDTYSPSVIANYIYDLAKSYNGYYHDHSHPARGERGRPCFPASPELRGGPRHPARHAPARHRSPGKNVKTQMPSGKGSRGTVPLFPGCLFRFRTPDVRFPFFIVKKPLSRPPGDSGTSEFPVERLGHLLGHLVESLLQLGPYHHLHHHVELGMQHQPHTRIVIAHLLELYPERKIERRTFVAGHLDIVIRYLVHHPQTHRHPLYLERTARPSAVQSSTCPCTTGVKLLKSLITE